MKAYLNDATLKDRFVQEIKNHRKADAIQQGTYGITKGRKWKGCAVACSVRSLDIIDGKDVRDRYNSHQEYETRLGIPATIAYLEDRIFEGLPKKKALDWPLRFAEAIPVGADLSLVTAKFMVWLLTDTKQYATDYPDVIKAMDGVIALYERVIAGGTVTEQEWSDAARAAYAADAARAAYAADAARAAAYAAYAADAARAARAADAARAAAYAARAADAASFEKMADKLIELLQEAPVGE